MADRARTAPRTVTAESGGVPLVFFPAVKQGAGIGHLMRCMSLFSEARERALLLLDRSSYDARPDVRGLVRRIPRERLLFHDASDEPPAGLPAGACVIFDRRETEPALFAAISSHALAVGLDEGGPCRRRFPILFDTLPMVKSRHCANAGLSPARLAAAEGRTFRFPFRRFLLSFGGEDEADLSGKLLAALLDSARVPPEAVAVVEGPLFSRRTWPAGVDVIRGCHNVPALLDRYDLIFTHYGLTAHDALGRGVPVVLFNPGSYHRRLARRDGIPEIGVKKVRRVRLRRLMESRAEHERVLAAFRKKYLTRPPLPDLICSFTPRGIPLCPVCGGQGAHIVERFPRKSYLRCRRCNTIRLVSWESPRRYSESYFADEYRSQYGRTYLEDFSRIKAMGERRLITIEQCRGAASPAGHAPLLLDVGAAFGPFLAAAKERGYETYGLEISSEGAAYIRNELGISCLTGDFLSRDIGVRLGEKSYDIITMWYVLEHFIDTGKALSLVNRLLKRGGIFALSTPSLGGISYRKNRRRFLEQSPDDHFSCWTPAVAGRALGRYGFTVVKTIVTGHHPERFFRKPPGRILRSGLLLLSQCFGLGDTCELYAVKTEDLS